jgi:hypothetical protein
LHGPVIFIVDYLVMIVKMWKQRDLDAAFYRDIDLGIHQLHVYGGYIQAH